MFLPTYEELYIVSDLHLGGTSGTPIFHQGQQFAKLIERLTERETPRGGTLGLVINGDFIDVLAEEVPGYVASPADAERAVAQILLYKDFLDIWEKLNAFVHRDKHRLVVVLGNHDIELAYPNIQEQVLNRLAGNDEVSRGRIFFATFGAGYRCRVGHMNTGFASVLCIHGNEFDNWNAMSPESMARLVRAATLGIPSPLASEAPNAGTQLVKDVMNAIKADWPFVDLLKPEVDSVFNVLLALDPKRANALGGVIKALSKAETAGEWRVHRVLGAETGTAQEHSALPKIQWKPGAQLAEFLGDDSGRRLSLEEIWDLAKKGGKTPEEIAGEEDQQILGGGRILWNLLDYSVRRIFASPKKALRAALADWGGSPETWEIDGACDVYDKLAEIKPAADVVVAGHTHLRRQKHLPAVVPSQKGPLYLNTGTWARLLRLDPKSFKSDEAFEPFWGALNSMKSLDRLPPTWLLTQPTVAVIRPDKKQPAVMAGLCEYRTSEGKDEDGFAPVENASWVPVVKA